MTSPFLEALQDKQKSICNTWQRPTCSCWCWHIL